MAIGVVGRHGEYYHSLGRAALLLGRLDEARRLGDRAVKYSRVCTPASRPMRCTCSATSRPIPTGSMPSAARPTTARRWRSPSRAACGPSSPTATSASAGSTGAPGKREQAQEHLTTATTMYREMDMQFWLEQAEAEMRELA